MGTNGYKHGHAIRGKLTRTYFSWTSMCARCNHTYHRSYQRYGGRGISVCDRWQGFKGFENFLADMGERPEGTTIDRVDVSGDYCPDNCRWATSKQQNRNKQNNIRLTHGGETKCLIEWAEVVGLHYRTLVNRIRRGWPVERALTTPARKLKKFRLTTETKDSTIRSLKV